MTFEEFKNMTEEKRKKDAKRFGFKVATIRVVSCFTKENFMEFLNIKNIDTMNKIEESNISDELSLQTLIKIYIGFADIKKRISDPGMDSFTRVYLAYVNEVLEGASAGIHNKLETKGKVLRKEYIR